MNRITAARTRIEDAGDLPALLAEAFTAFEDIVQVLHLHLERDDGTFPAFILSAGAAANGRDRIAAAPSLPPAIIAAFLTRPAPATDGLLAEVPVLQVAAAVAALTGALAGQLAAAATAAADPRDQISCTHAARHATRILSLLGGAREP
jgi:hypothetical protein